MWWGAVNRGLVQGVWCAWGGGVKLGDEAVARVVNMGKGGASRSGGWDGGV